jgi:hypothetical protein
MVRVIVGGRDLDLTKDEVVRRMRDVQPEPIREHLVEIGNAVFPPKQVLAQVTGWDRQSFTTMEANRVFRRLGFVCRRAGRRPNDHPVWMPETLQHQEQTSIDRRLSAIEFALAVAQEAIAGLRNRVTKLEARRQEP